jgi:UDP-glucuronate 4-epimerase
VLVLITGIAEFIGMHTAEQLFRRGEIVVGVDNFNDYYPIALKKAWAGVRYSLNNPAAYVTGHVNILEIACHRSVQHLVYASSSSVYGANKAMPFRVEDRVDRPISLYAVTKCADELMRRPMRISSAFLGPGCVSLRFAVRGGGPTWRYAPRLLLHRRYRRRGNT